MSTHTAAGTLARLLSVCALLAAPVTGAQASDAMPATPSPPPPLEHFIQRDSFLDIKISPDGKHLAANMPVKGGSALFMLDSATLQRQGHFYAGEDLEVADFWWSSDTRLLISPAQRFLGDEAPSFTGEIYAVNVDGSQPIALVGYRADDGRQHTRIKNRENESVWALPIDLLPGVDRQVLVQVEPWSNRGSNLASIERLDTRTGRRTRVATSPVPRADFHTDAAGNLRFAEGLNADNEQELHHLPPGSEAWALLDSPAKTGQQASVLGFSSDGSAVFLQVSRPEGPDAIERFVPASGERREVYRHERRDPDGPILSLDRTAVLGVYVRDPQRQMHLFEPDHPEAKLQLSLAAAFRGHDVQVTSATRDGRQAIVLVYSDRNPGEYFLFDRDTKRARHIGSRGRDLVPEQMGETRQVQIKARDGVLLDALLTLPPGADTGTRNLPLVVHPHGGPFEVQDRWGFDTGVQLMATRGFAVLQVNFRGSGGRGRAFVRAGYRQWGQAMQDDLTDATRWAIDQGFADARRICIYGASYGGYASLMGAAREPDLYACAAGDVGVYDLEEWSRRVDFKQFRWGRNYLRDTVGTEGLRDISPVHLASRIKVPVFLAAGENDRRAPVEQTEMMEAAIKRVGIPVTTLYFRGEGHGYYSLDNKRKFYAELLAFLDQHIGSGWRPR